MQLGFKTKKKKKKELLASPIECRCFDRTPNNICRV